MKNVKVIMGLGLIACVISAILTMICYNPTIPVGIKCGDTNIAYRIDDLHFKTPAINEEYEEKNEIPTTYVKKGDRLSVDFGIEPALATLYVLETEFNGEVEKWHSIPLGDVENGEKIILPDKTGIYTFYIFATWKAPWDNIWYSYDSIWGGECNYFFKISVE